MTLLKNCKIFFSIIIPIYNSQKYLRECLSSISNQNFENIEVILIDDKSIDNSKKIYNSFRSKIKNLITLKNSKNLGVSLSRNKGLKKAKGEYIIFLDSDDILLKNILKKAKEKILNKSENDIFLCDFKELKKNIIKSKEKIQTFKSKYINNKKNLNKLNYFSQFCWNYIIKSEFLIKKKIFFNNIRINEDHLFVSKLLFLNSKITKLKLSTHGRRVAELNTLGRSIGYPVCLSALKNLLSMSIDKDFFTKNRIKKEFIKQRLRFFLKNFYLNLHICKKEQIKNLIKIIQNSKIIFQFLNQYGFNLNYLEKKNLNTTFYFNLIEKNYKKIDTFLFSKEVENFYLFCASDYSKFCVKVLKKLSYSTNICFDNNYNFHNKYLLHLKIKKIDKKFSARRSKYKILVCNLNNNAFKEIKIQLLQNKFKKNQIINFDLISIINNNYLIK